MNYQGKQINHVLILRRSNDEDSTDTTCCVTDGDPMKYAGIFKSCKNDDFYMKKRRKFFLFFLKT